MCDAHGLVILRGEGGQGFAARLVVRIRRETAFDIAQCRENGSLVGRERGGDAGFGEIQVRPSFAAVEDRPTRRGTGGVEAGARIVLTEKVRGVAALYAGDSA